MTRAEEIEKGIKYFKDNNERMVALYKEMYGATICLTCPGSIEHAYEKMFKDRNKEICNFKMKRGDVINTIMSDNPILPKGHYTIHNMTDELARLFIDNGYASKFIL